MEDNQKTYAEYRSKVLSSNGPHIYTVTNSYGVYDYYKYYRHNRPKDRSYYKMNEKQYYKLIRTVNEYLIDLLFKNMRVELPDNFGELIIQRRDATVSYKNGKVKTNRPVNWEETLKLWFEDSEAERNKTLVRWDVNNVTTIDYKKVYAKFPNKAFYEFQIVRKLKRRLSSLLAETGFETPFFVDYTVDSLKSLYNG